MRKALSGLLSGLGMAMDESVSTNCKLPPGMRPGVLETTGVSSQARSAAGGKSLNGRSWMMKIILSIAVTVAIATGPAWAEDLEPPWWRNEPGTTYQRWEFMNPGQSPPPDDGWAVDSSGQHVPVLLSTRIEWIDPAPGWDYMTFYEGAEGVWPLSGWMEVVVDNWPEPNPKKLIRVQLTWSPMDETMYPNPYPMFTNIIPPPVDPPGVELIHESPVSAMWMHSVYAWELDENPMDEWFTITGDIFVDELVIDTWCVPEPATMGLLALGGLAMLRRRRRRA